MLNHKGFHRTKHETLFTNSILLTLQSKYSYSYANVLLLHNLLKIKIFVFFFLQLPFLKKNKNKQGHLRARETCNSQ